MTGGLPQLHHSDRRTALAWVATCSLARLSTEGVKVVLYVKEQLAFMELCHSPQVSWEFAGQDQREANEYAVVMAFCCRPSNKEAKQGDSLFTWLKEDLWSGRQLKMFIGYGIRKAKILLQLKLAGEVNGKRKDFCKYTHRKSRCFCDEELEGIVVVKALFAKVFTTKAHF